MDELWTLVVASITIPCILGWLLHNSYQKRNLRSENSELRMRVELLNGYSEVLLKNSGLVKKAKNESLFLQEFPQSTTGSPTSSSNQDVGYSKTKRVPELIPGGEIEVGRPLLLEIEDLPTQCNDVSIELVTVEEREAEKLVKMEDVSKEEGLLKDIVQNEETKVSKRSKPKMGELKRAQMPGFDFLSKIRFASNMDRSSEVSAIEGVAGDADIIEPPNSKVETTYPNVDIEMPILESSDKGELLLNGERERVLNNNSILTYPWTIGEHTLEMTVCEEYGEVIAFRIEGHESLTYLNHPHFEKLEVGDRVVVRLLVTENGIREVLSVSDSDEGDQYLDVV